MKLYLIAMEADHSPYIRDLINKDRLARGDPKLIDQEIQRYTKMIQELKEQKKAKPLNEAKIHDILESHAPNYKQNAPTRSDTQRIRFIEGSIISELKKLGYKGTARDIDEILLNWPEE